MACPASLLETLTATGSLNEEQANALCAHFSSKKEMGDAQSDLAYGLNSA